MVLFFDFHPLHPQLRHLFKEPPLVGNENLTLLIVCARLQIARTAAVTIVGIGCGKVINKFASLVFSTMLSAYQITYQSYFN